MITNQAYLFLIFTVNGVIIGLLFDFFRILRRSFKTKDFVTYTQDVLFWILTGLILLYSIFVFNNGEIRLFMFLGVAIGVILYMLVMSSYVIKINVYIINIFKKVFGRIIGIILIPFKFIYKLIKQLFFKPVSFFIINFRKFSTNFSKKLKNNIKDSKNKVKN